MPKWFTVIFSVLWAPLVEELVFRGSIRRFIKNDKVFIAVSSVVFGLMHTIFEASLVNVILLGLPYIVIGIYLSYLYSKSNNICSSILGHTLINLISSIIICLFI
jgi:hypothetical protein